MMNCNLSGSCIDVTLEAYKSVPRGYLPFVVVQYALCKTNEKGEFIICVYVMYFTDL